MSSELAVVWETIPVNVLQQAYSHFIHWTSQFPERVRDSIQKSQLVALKSNIPYIDSLELFITKGNAETIRAIPLVALSSWSQELRQNHHLENRWPEYFGDTLAEWITQQPIDDSIKTLSDIRYTYAVIYLPIFMAHVTTGKASLSTLSTDTAYVKYCINRVADFDRVGWYEPTYKLMVSYLLRHQAEK